MQHPKIKIYKNLLEEQEEMNSWTSDNSFFNYNLTSSERNKLIEINAIEVIFPGFQGRSELRDNVFIRYQAFTKEYILDNVIPVYLFKVEHRVGMKNRVRSYKGIISKKMNDEDYIETELETSNNYSLILGMALINSSNIDYLFNSFYDSATCLMLSTSEKIFSCDFLKAFYDEYIVITNTVSVNYMKLIMEFCKDNNVVLRAAGDGGDAEVNLQIFTLATGIGKLLKQVNQNISKIIVSH